ncbi:MAG: hypothetical protein GXP30_03940 [Verrucomicrobia bacterium]|nr:hypothetical protein [Verrucomicrobiota bacterium]
MALKTIANPGTIQKAQSLKLLLGSIGIEAFIPDELMAGIAPHLFMTRTGVRVQVEEEEEEDAMRLIEDGFELIEDEEAH